MLDPITALILKVIASTCVKFYLASLLGAGQVTYSSAELGYKIPKWYMNPGRVSRTFYSYGTSVNGDEFESIEDARRKGVDQMAQHIRLGNRALIEKEVHYDTNSVKQKRLIELFVRGDGLEPFIRMNAKMGKKQLVKVKVPRTDMRAFVRLEMKSKTYIAYQGKTLNELKTRLMQQKTEDIMAEMEAELAAWEAEAAALPGAAIPTGIKPGDITPPTIPDLPPSAPSKKPPAPAGGTSGGPFGDMEKELNDAN
jgi:hypothetical protein